MMTQQMYLDVMPPCRSLPFVFGICLLSAQDHVVLGPLFCSWAHFDQQKAGAIGWLIVLVNAIVLVLAVYKTATIEPAMTTKYSLQHPYYIH